MGTPDPLAIALREAGRAQGLTQAQMCEKAGLYRDLLSRACRGRTSMNVTSVRLLAEVVGCDLVLQPRQPVEGEVA